MQGRRNFSCSSFGQAAFDPLLETYQHQEVIPAVRGITDPVTRHHPYQSSDDGTKSPEHILLHYAPLRTLLLH